VGQEIYAAINCCGEKGGVVHMQSEADPYIKQSTEANQTAQHTEGHTRVLNRVMPVRSMPSNETFR